MGKLLPAGEISKHLAGKKRAATKIIPFRVKITPLGIGNFKESDESTTYKQEEIVWYKAHPKAKPEILIYRGLHILNYHEFVSDILVNKRRYRIFYNPIAKKYFANEIIKMGKDIYIKNPSCDEDFVKGLREFIKDFPAPENKKLHSINKAIREYKKEKSASKPKLKRRGRKEEDYLKEATLWAIENQQPKESRPAAARRAYGVFKDKAQSEQALVRAINRKWTGLSKLHGEKYPFYKSENEKWKRRVSFKPFAKKILKPTEAPINKGRK
jgi:hypothetical protein